MLQGRSRDVEPPRQPTSGPSRPIAGPSNSRALWDLRLVARMGWSWNLVEGVFAQLGELVKVCGSFAAATWPPVLMRRADAVE